MEITPGRAAYIPDEEVKTLRLPKTNYSEVIVPHTTLSINAAEFVPRPANIQDRLQINQRQPLQKNHQHIQQPPQEQCEEQDHVSYSIQRQQLYKQPSQNLNTQMNALSVHSVQDRLRTVNNGGNRSTDGGHFCYQQQQQPGGNSVQQSQNFGYHYNKNHFNRDQQQQQQLQHQIQYQQRLNTYQYQGQHQNLHASSLAESANDMENIALDYLQTVIQCLNQNPGQFDTIATRFNYIFDGMENNQYVLSIAMEDIFDESVRNPNFRYMGAKLYNLLHTLNPSKDSLFQRLLKCKLDYHRGFVRDFLQKREEVRVRETALFLAELYMQLRGEESRNHLIAEHIVYLLKELLSMDDNKENIRCTCLTLKLAGYDLSADCPIDMAHIISKLDAINCKNPGKYPMANNVISLQRNNWGRKPIGTEPPVGPETSNFIEPPRHSDDPVFYGPDGREISAEECEFLTNGAAGTATSSENEEDNYDVDLDPEMDEETERDFKLFLKQTSNKS